MGRLRGNKGNTKHNPAQQANLARQCFDLKSRGKTYREIEDILGIPHQTVYRWVKREIDRTILPAADEARKLEIDRYDRWLAVLEERLAAGDPTHTTVQTMLKVSERRAKLLGLDMPIKVEATITETTQADLEWAELVREKAVQDALRAQQGTDGAQVHSDGAALVDLHTSATS
jgi:transposase